MKTKQKQYKTNKSNKKMKQNRKTHIKQMKPEKYN